MPLRALSEASLHPTTDTSQRFLASGYDAVAAVLDNLSKIRELRRLETGDIRGRLTANEEDLLRAAIVFTGAGLDATLKQLIRDSLPSLLETNTQAHEKFETFAADRIGHGRDRGRARRSSLPHVSQPERTPNRGLCLRSDGVQPPVC